MHFRAMTPEGDMVGQVNFYLGLSNYQLGKAAKDRARLEEALKFSRAAAAIAGPTQEAAARNAAAIQQELTRK